MNLKKLGDVSILSRSAPPRRLSEWIVCHDAYTFWESLCEDHNKTVSYTPDVRALCPHLSLFDFPLKQQEDNYIDSIIDSYHETCKKRKMSVKVESDLGSEIKLDIHNIVMVMELKQRIEQSSLEELGVNNVETERQIERNDDMDINETIWHDFYEYRKVSLEKLYESGVIPSDISKDEMAFICKRDVIEDPEDYCNKITKEQEYEQQRTEEEEEENREPEKQQSFNEASSTNGLKDYNMWKKHLKDILSRISPNSGPQSKNPNTINVNPLVQFIRSEKEKFYAYALYMAKSVKDPVFVKILKKYKVFPNFEQRVLKEKENDTGDYMDVDCEKNEEDEDDDFLQKEVESLMEVDEHEISVQNVSKMATNSYSSFPSSTKDINISSSLYSSQFYSTSTQEHIERDNYMKLPRLRVNLPSIANATIKLGSQYNQRKFASVSCRSNFFQSTIQIYPHGTITSTGSTHEIISLIAFQNILNILREISGPLSFEDPYIKLKNLVLSGHLGYSICTILLTHQYSSYFRQIKAFSGIAFVNWNGRQDKITLLIFRGGSICVSGGGSIESVRENTKLALTMIEKCKETPENLKLEKNISG